MTITKELLYFIRAILFGITVGYLVFYFVVFFKPWTEKTFGFKKIDVDLWWWGGITVAVLTGIIIALLMM